MLYITIIKWMELQALIRIYEGLDQFVFNCAVTIVIVVVFVVVVLLCALLFFYSQFCLVLLLLLLSCRRPLFLTITCK